MTALQKLSLTRASVAFHRWDRPQIIRRMFYDCEVHCGIVLGFFSIGFWRPACDADFEVQA
jgi:hypothetical protein